MRGASNGHFCRHRRGEVVPPERPGRRRTGRRVRSPGSAATPPGAEDSAATISAYYDSHEVREMLAAFVLAASAPLFVIFAIWLAASLWPSDSLPRPIWHTVLGVGGAVAAGGFLAAALIHVALAQTANANDVGAGGLQALAGLDESSWVAFNAGLGVMMLGAAGSCARNQGAPGARMDRSHRRDRTVHPVRRLLRADGERSLDHLDEHRPFPARACVQPRAT